MFIVQCKHQIQIYFKIYWLIGVVFVRHLTNHDVIRFLHCYYFNVIEMQNELFIHSSKKLLCFNWFGIYKEYTNDHDSNIMQDYHCFISPSWWRHQKEKDSVLLALCAGNSPVTGEFPSQRPVTRSFDVFFDVLLNKWLSKQSRSRWL